LISVCVPAMSAQTYQAVMGIDGLKEVIGNIGRLIERRMALGRGTPLIVPVFVKMNENLGEMDAWYDHWLRAVGSAVISGPSDFCGKIADVGVAKMEPPKRRACARLSNRLTVLSDGKIVSCEQDLLGEQALGMVGRDRIEEVWMGRMGKLRLDHAEGKWANHPLCGACREWHRA
jgi:hypothetical protein